MNEDRDVVGALSLVREALAGEYEDLQEMAISGTHALFSARPTDRRAELIGLVVAVGPQGEAVTPARSLAQAAVITARLEHPNVMPVKPARVIGGYWTYERALGTQTVADLFAPNKHETFERAVALVRDVGAALDHAHSMNIVHGALRPACIYIEPGGRCVVDGFTHEIANPVEAAALDPEALPYEAPERRRTGRIDGRADQYALAIILHELLTGFRRAIRDDSGVLEIQALEIPVGRELAPGVPAYAAAALRRALARDPNARFETVKAFVDAFTGAAAANQDSPQLLQVARKESRRSRAGAVLLLVAALLVGALVVAPNETTAMLVRTWDGAVEWWSGIGADVDLSKVNRKDTPRFGSSGAATATTNSTNRSQTRPSSGAAAPAPSVDRSETQRGSTTTREAPGTTVSSSEARTPSRRESGRISSLQSLAGAEPATPDRGVLLILTDAGRPLVSVNRLPRGRAPLSLRLKPGTYTVSLMTRQGYRPKTMQVSVTAGDTAYAEFAAPDELFVDTLFSLGRSRIIASAGM